MKGYYSMGLCGYEVEVNEDCESVSYRYITPTSTDPKPHRAIVRYTAKGKAYFLANGQRIHLSECLRT